MKRIRQAVVLFSSAWTVHKAPKSPDVECERREALYFYIFSSQSLLSHSMNSASFCADTYGGMASSQAISSPSSVSIAGICFEGGSKMRSSTRCSTALPCAQIARLPSTGPTAASAEMGMLNCCIVSDRGIASRSAPGHCSCLSNSNERTPALGIA